MMYEICYQGIYLSNMKHNKAIYCYHLKKVIWRKSLKASLCFKWYWDI